MALVCGRRPRSPSRSLTRNLFQKPGISPCFCPGTLSGGLWATVWGSQLPRLQNQEERRSQPRFLGSLHPECSMFKCAGSPRVGETPLTSCDPAFLKPMWPWDHIFLGCVCWSPGNCLLRDSESTLLSLRGPQPASQALPTRLALCGGRFQWPLCGLRHLP